MVITCVQNHCCKVGSKELEVLMKVDGVYTGILVETDWTKNKISM